MAPADGTLVNIEVRPRGAGKADIRGVISYSCTFFSYFDLANSLSDEIAAKMPQGWETQNGPQKVSIAVKQGQVLAKVGGQSLDFAVWDTTKFNKSLLVPAAYDNYEPWKIVTVPPTDYYADAVKTELAPVTVRKVAPADGTYAYDVDGKAVGGWFKQGTNGYIGAFSEGDYNSQTYADGHLALAPNLFDPTSWVFSTGMVDHGHQYAIKNPSVAPDKLSTESGLVKYELAQNNYKDENGASWLGATVPKSIKVVPGQSQATALVQLTAKRELKVEVVLNKTPDQVAGFSDKAVVYTRGDGAKAMMR
jgi:hypothetical protein